jgi:rSAM/selenodomain-associated transferase 1
MADDTVILVFAKAPIEGQVNTRLIPSIGKQAATQLQYDLVHQRLTMLTQAKLSDVILMCSPDVEQEFFIECKEKYFVSLRKQSGNDLGERMFNGISEALKNYRHCIVVGTDAPALGGYIVQQSIETLREGKSVVFVPAEDGGYVLVGMNQPYEMLFQNIDL